MDNDPTQNLPLGNQIIVFETVLSRMKINPEELVPITNHIVLLARYVAQGRLEKSYVVDNIHILDITFKTLKAISIINKDFLYPEDSELNISQSHLTESEKFEGLIDEVWKSATSKEARAFVSREPETRSDPWNSFVLGLIILQLSENVFKDFLRKGRVLLMRVQANSE